MTKVRDTSPTVMAAWYGKSTYTSRPTPYVVIVNDKDTDRKV